MIRHDAIGGVPLEAKSSHSDGGVEASTSVPIRSTNIHQAFHPTLYVVLDETVTESKRCMCTLFNRLAMNCEVFNSWVTGLWHKGWPAGCSKGLRTSEVLTTDPGALGPPRKCTRVSPNDITIVFVTSGREHGCGGTHVITCRETIGNGPTDKGLGTANRVMPHTGRCADAFRPE